MPCDAEAMASSKGILVRAKTIVDIAHSGTGWFRDMLVEELEGTE